MLHFPLSEKSWSVYLLVITSDNIHKRKQREREDTQLDLAISRQMSDLYIYYIFASLFLLVDARNDNYYWQKDQYDQNEVNDDSFT